MTPTEARPMAPTIMVPCLGNGWYSFADIPQEGNYVKIHVLKCGTDRKALNRAKRINPNYAYQIEPNLDDMFQEVR